MLGAVPLALALLGGRPAPRLLAGATVVVAGATLATGLGSGDLPGLLWSLGALVGEVSFSLLAIPLLPKLGAIRVSAYSTVLAGPCWPPSASPGRAPACSGCRRSREALGLAYLAIVVTVGAFLLWYTALPKLGPGRAGCSPGSSRSAPSSPAWSSASPPRPVYDLLGAALVIAGILLGLSADRTAKPAHVTAAGPLNRRSVPLDRARPRYGGLGLPGRP